MGTVTVAETLCLLCLILFVFELAVDHFSRPNEHNWSFNLATKRKLKGNYV